MTLREVIAKVDQLRALPKGWNGYGAPRLRRETCDRVLATVLSLAPKLPTFVAPMNDGGVSLYYGASDPEEVTVEVLPASGYTITLCRSLTEDRRDEMLTSVRALISLVSASPSPEPHPGDRTESKSDVGAVGEAPTKGTA